MLKHLEKLDEFIEGACQPYTLGPAIFRALVACLSPEQSTDYLARDFSQPYAIRHIVISRILKDIQAHFDDCHRQMTQELMDSFPGLPAAAQRSCASILRMIAPHAPNLITLSIYRTLLPSPRRIIRDYALRHVRDVWDGALLPLVLQVWCQHRDTPAAWLLATHLDGDELADHIDDLLDALLERPSLLAASVARLDQHQKQILGRIQHKDAITHCYVLTKVGLKLTTKQAVALFRQQCDSDRASLLIWCFGQMQLWDAVIQCNALKKS